MYTQHLHIDKIQIFDKWMIKLLSWGSNVFSEVSVEKHQVYAIKFNSAENKKYRPQEILVKEFAFCIKPTKNAFLIEKD